MYMYIIILLGSWCTHTHIHIFTHIYKYKYKMVSILFRKDAGSTHKRTCFWDIPGEHWGRPWEWIGTVRKSREITEIRWKSRKQNLLKMEKLPRTMVRCFQFNFKILSFQNILSSYHLRKASVGKLSINVLNASKVILNTELLNGWMYYLCIRYSIYLIHCI